MKDLVSIITPSYNSANFIEETINSVIAQTYQNWEMIIVDDCSKDNSVELIQEYVKKDNRIKLIQNKENKGAAETRNEALKIAKGRFIAFLDSDDLWAKDKLEVQTTFMISKDLAFSYAAYQKMSEEGEKGTIFYPPKKICYKDLLKTCSIGCLTAMYDVEKLGKMKMPSIRRRQDYGLWLKIHKKIGFSEGIDDKVLAYYRVRAESVSANKFKAARYHFKVLKKYTELNYLQVYYYFIHYAFNGILKYFR